MNNSLLSIAFSLGTLLLSPAAMAGDRDALQREAIELPPQQHAPQSQRDSGELKEWYLLRHRELRPHGYQPIKRIYRINTIQHRATPAATRPVVL